MREKATNGQNGPPCEADERFLRILDSLKAIVYVADMQSYEVLYVNRYARELFGDIEGRPCWQTIQNGQDGPCPFCSNPQLVDAAGQPLGVYTWEIQNTRNGLWYELHDQAIEWVDGRIVRLEIATDITARKEAEQSLARQTRALKLSSRCNEVLFHSQCEEDLVAEMCRVIAEEGDYPLVWVVYQQESAPVPVAHYGDGQGYTEIATRYWSSEPGSDSCPIMAAIHRGERVYLSDIQAGSLPADWQQEAVQKGLHAILALPLMVDNKIIGAVVVHAHDSAAFDNRQQELLVEVADNLAYGIATLRLRQDKQKATEQLALIEDALPIVPYTRELSDAFPFRYVGSAISRLTGHQADSFLADPLFWLNHIHPDDRGHALRALKEAHEQTSQKCEYRFQVADGSYRWFASIRRLVRAANDDIPHIVGAWQDISDEKKAQQEADLRMQQVIQADKLASLGEVVAGVAHEINNPNSFITYNIPLLEESWQTFAPIVAAHASTNPGRKAGHVTLAEMAEEMAEIIHAIKTGSDRINKIVANLKDFARLEESAPSKLIDINRVVKDTLTIVGAQARKYAGTIEIALADGLPRFYGHFQKLEQVMVNLITNAAQSIPVMAKGRITIATRYNKRLNAILVEVQDNGRGMSASDVERIFDPFFTTKRDSGGTGLGLSVSYGLIQEHKGRIAVMSRPGLGSKFTIFLPVDRRQEQLELKPTILCVDDDPQVLNFLRLYFAGVDKMPVATISSGREVLNFIDEHPEVDMVLSDIMMAGMDGWQLLEQVKKHHPLLPVILITGVPDQEDELQRRELLPDLFLIKPLDPNTLAQSIAALGRQRL